MYMILLLIPRNVLLNIFGFHALTGWDTFSAFSGISKKTCKKKFITCPDLLSDVERNLQSDKAEKFVCLLYWIQKDSVDDARYSLFVRANKTFEMLSPTTDALLYVLGRLVIRF